MLSKSKLSPSSVRNKKYSLRSFFRFLVLDSYIKADPTEGLVTPKVWRKLQDVLSEADVELLLQQPDVSIPFGLRDRAMLETLYATGLRNSELRRIRLDEIKFEEGYLRAFGKGSKERIVPIGDSAPRFIKRYMSEVRPSLVLSDDEPLLFLTQQGGQLSKTLLWNLVKMYGDQAGLKVYPHILRRSCASHMLDNGARLEAVQKLLGHVSIETTGFYLRLSRAKIRESYDKHHPRA